MGATKKGADISANHMQVLTCGEINSVCQDSSGMEGGMSR